mmetsp:Transcript_9636/g.21405  ORF Transcript_9636/g.21405 Transcript_9636/m.21405 type:complete len:570 (-) Transcript_9636:180-1889(-)
MNFPLALSLIFCIFTRQVKGIIDQTVDPDVISVAYKHDGYKLLGHVAKPKGDGPFPAVIIIPDWDGVNSYEQTRAAMIAKDWGFVAFAADIYGKDLQTVTDLYQKIQLSNKYRSNPDLFVGRIDAAIDQVSSFDYVDSNSIVLFGYCFGGTGVLQYGFDGSGDVKGVVSFHGGLTTLPKDRLQFGPKVLVLSGGDDDTSTAVMDLEKTFDAAGASWEITRYSGVYHGFTAFDSDRYDAWADARSWESAYQFTQETLDIVAHESAKPDEIAVEAVKYTAADGTAMMGWLALPEQKWKRPLPAVIILPDWDGVNDYEKQRATALAKNGYVAFAADIYGADKQFVADFSERQRLVMKFNSDPDLYVSRMQMAIQQVKLMDADVDVNEVVMIGYCFGGTGVVLYSLSNGSDAKAAVAFHGSFSSFNVLGPVIPKVLVLSGGDDFSHGNQTVMEGAFDQGQAMWEITRYAGVNHGFTKFDSYAYDIVADSRSWNSMLNYFHTIIPVPVKNCEEAPKDKFFFKKKNGIIKLKPCKWLGKRTKAQIKKQCAKNKYNGEYGPAKAVCRITCKKCKKI